MQELAPSATPGPEELIVSHSALSGSSKTPFPPDRSFVNDFEWTKHSRWGCVWVGAGPVREEGVDIS